jgi:hypothetical protein
MKLTEDRTFSSDYAVRVKIAQSLPALTDKAMLRKLLLAETPFEQGIGYDYALNISGEFYEVAEELYGILKAYPSSRTLVEKKRKILGDFKPATLKDWQHQLHLSAYTHLAKIGCTLSPEEVEFTESLGSGILGVYLSTSRRIWLSIAVFDRGLESVVATLYEEWVHREHGFSDLSFGMQDFLFQRIAAIAINQLKG